MNECIFCKIANKEIPKEFTYEDKNIMVFPDIHPVKPIHLLVVPKKHIAEFVALNDQKLFHELTLVLQKMIKKSKLGKTGHRIVINGGGLQEVNHLHIHLMGPMLGS